MAEANQIIFIEAFLASKKIKLTLFLQALFKALKTTITFWCFVFVTLFNLQGTRCVPQRFLMISLRFPFVKNFFQKLFSFFQALSSARTEVLSAFRLEPVGPSLKCLLILPDRAGFVNTFLRLFSFFFTFRFLRPSLAYIHPQKTLLQKDSSYDTLIYSLILYI